MVEAGSQGFKGTTWLFLFTDTAAYNLDYKTQKMSAMRNMWSAGIYQLYVRKPDRVGPVDNRPSTI